MGLADTRFENRRRKLASLLAGHRIDDMLVTHLTHVRYLSGFSGSNGALLISKDRSARILSLIHISEPTRQCCTSRMPSSA